MAIAAKSSESTSSLLSVDKGTVGAVTVIPTDASSKPINGLAAQAKGVRPEVRKRTMTSAEVLNLIRDVKEVGSGSGGGTGGMSTVHEEDVKLDIVSTASPLRKSGSLKNSQDLDNVRKSVESVRRSTESVMSVGKKSAVGARSPTLDPLLGTVDECLAHAICVQQPDSDGDDEFDESL